MSVTYYIPIQSEEHMMFVSEVVELINLFHPLVPITSTKVVKLIKEHCDQQSIPIPVMYYKGQYLTRVYPLAICKSIVEQYLHLKVEMRNQNGNER